MIIKINKTLSKSERENLHEIVSLLVNLDEEVKKKLLYMMLGMELLGTSGEEKIKEVVRKWRSKYVQRGILRKYKKDYIK